jgi:calcineurin-like phosphoesterase family protein
MEYFSSDRHFNHNRMATMRGFSSVEEMNETIIENHNKVVKENDIIYELGDFCFRGNPIEFLNRLNGHFYFVRGNHDQKKIDFYKVQHWVDGYYDIQLHGEKITLCHYPMISWNCSHYNSIQIHGHHHNATIIQEKFPGRRMNVSMEATNFTPVSFYEMIEYIDRRCPDNWDLVDKKREEWDFK